MRIAISEAGTLMLERAGKLKHFLSDQYGNVLDGGEELFSERMRKAIWRKCYARLYAPNA